MSRISLALLPMVAVGLALATSCNNAPTLGPNNSIFGAPEVVEGQTGASPADTLCQKFESCGLLSGMQSGGQPANRVENDPSFGDDSFGMRVARLVQRDVDVSSKTYAQFSGAGSVSPMTACVEQIDKTIKGLEKELNSQISIPWGSLMYCVAAGSCTDFTSSEGWQRLGSQCASQLGYDINGGSSSPKPQPNPPSKPKDGGVQPPKPDSGPPSGGDVCARATAKLKSCVDGLNCSDFSGADASLCEAFKSANLTPPEVCEGEDKTAAEQLDDCALDELCRCAS